MPTISTPASVFDHTIDPIAGYDIAPGHALNYTAPVSSNVTLTPWEGMVVHLNASGEFEVGCRADKMPIFLMQPSKPYGHLSTVQALNPGQGWQSIGLFPRAGLVATGGFEIATTSYDSAQTYLPNQYLTAKYSNTDATAGGMLTNKVPGTNTAVTYPGRASGTTVTVCGMVTRPPTTLRNGNTVLSLWTCFFPGSTDA